MNIVQDIESYVVNKVGEAKSLMALAKLEAKLAKLSLVPLLITLFAMLFVVSSTWLFTMILLSYGIFYFFHNIWFALGGVLIFNLIILGILVKYLLFNIKSMSFEKTRKYLSGQTGQANYERKEKAITKNK